MSTNKLVKLCYLLSVLLFLSIIVISGAHHSILLASVSLLLLITFLGTAWPLSRLLLGHGPLAFVFTFPIGYCCHAFFLSVLARIFGTNITVFLIYAVVAFVAFILTWKRGSSKEFEFIQWDVRDTILLLSLLLLTSFAVAWPFLHVGMDTPQGVAYRAYFNTDFFRHMAVTANISQVGLPPDNPYFSGIILRYYWFFHIIPAFWKVLLPSFRLDFLLVQFQLVVALLFVASLFAAVRAFTSSRISSVLLFPLMLFGGSYEGVYVLYQLKALGLPWYRFTDWNVDAILRWFWQAPQVDTLYRGFLYAPQHLIGLSVFLIMILIWKRTSSSLFRRLLLYALIFSTVGFTVIIAGAIVVGVAILLLFEFFRSAKKKWKEIVLSGTLGILFLLAYIFVFQMFSFGAGDLKAEPNVQVVRNLAGFVLLNWGAILLVGVAGIFLGNSRLPRTQLLLYLGIAAALIFSINIHVPGKSEITLKMGFLSTVVLLLFAATFIDRYLNEKRLLLIGGLIVLLLPGFLTWYMEIYNNQDVSNKQFTTIVPSDDWQLYQWMKQTTEPGATAQNYWLAGEGFLQQYVSPIPALAERTVYLGDKVHSRLYQITDKDVETRSRIVWKLFHLSSPGQISTLTQRAGIEYLILGSNDGLFLFEAQLQPPYFSLAKQVGKARLYKVHRRNVSTAEMEQKILLQNNEGMTLLEASYGKGFYNPEMETGLETSRWMERSAIIHLQAHQDVSGTVTFTAHSFGSERTLQVQLDGSPILEKRISPQGIKVSIPVSLQAGKHQLELKSVEQPGDDGNRMLSIRVWNLQFSNK